MHEIIIFVAKYFVILPFVGVVFMAIRLPKSDQLKLLSILLIGGAISFALSRISSQLYQDPRPFVAGHFTPLLPHGANNGFPSDHTLISAFLAYAVIYFSKKLGLALITVAILIGLSRVAAGVHHFIDIIGSFIIAGIGSYCAVLLINYLAKKKTPAAVR